MAMKVTFLVYNIYGIGGTVRTVVNTANYLASAGYEVEIISVRKTRTKPTFRIDKKIKLKPLLNVKKGISKSGIKGFIADFLNKMPSILIDKNEDLYKMFTMYTDFLIRTALKQLKTDVLITTVPSFNLLAIKYADSKIIRIGQEHAQFSVHGRSLKRKIKKNYAKLDALTVLTKKENEAYKALFDNKLNIIEIPNATQKTDIRVNYNNKMIVTAGRFVYQKGFERLIKSYVPIAKKYPDWTLRIYGSGYDYELMRETINRYNLYNHVFLFPSSKNILHEFGKASIFVLPSRFEPFGMVVIEAMSVGLPIVSYDSYGPAKIIEDGKDGFIVEMDNEKELKNKISQLIENKKLRKKMGEEAINKADYYSENTIGKIWEESFLQLKNNKTK
ncbi:glycosyltransferase family 4 protein [Carnobacterium sp. FSL W8-0810]|uniref:glycosyltransferase family 4 protein n=1 Tax=Carnobacterium sp. FSL W8-0810 TaxID=2954705 RepID=UPI0030F7926D